MNKVIGVRAMGAGVVWVELDDGRRGEFDLRPYMVSDYFRELESEAYFSQVRVCFHGIGWPNGQDLGPDTVAAELGETECSTV